MTPLLALTYAAKPRSHSAQSTQGSLATTYTVLKVPGPLTHTAVVSGGSPAFYLRNSDSVCSGSCVDTDGSKGCICSSQA